MLIWFLACALASVTVGIFIGIALSGRSSQLKERIQALESDLESMRAARDTALDDLTAERDATRRQFTRTARRFRDLSEAHMGLHRQLVEQAEAMNVTEIDELLDAPGGDGDSRDALTNGTDRETSTDEADSTPSRTEAFRAAREGHAPLSTGAGAEQAADASTPSEEERKAAG